MSVSYGKGPKGTATRLHSKVIRTLGYCENCGDPDYDKLQAAHIVSRTYSATRTDLRNAFCLCASCHRHFTDWPREFSHFISNTWAQELYDHLKEIARPNTKVDWKERVVFLKEILSQINKGTLTLAEAREMEKL